MRKIKTFVLAVMLCFCALPSTAYAAAYETEVINTLKMGDISISLDEYELGADGNEIPYQNEKVVLPGQKVDKIVRITNEANPAWVRAKLEYTSEDGIKDLSDALVTISDDEWIKRGDYYYYQSPVDRDASVDFIKNVVIPPEWDNSYAEKSFTIVITADAVQTANFEPDFESEDPWFGTVIEVCTHTVHDDTYVIDNTPFAVEFRGGAEGLVKVGDNFFSKWSSLMPGDVVSDKVHIRNQYGRTARIYFRTETIADDILLDALTLEIRNGDTTIFSGSLADYIEKDIQIASLKKGQERILNYTLSVPAELNNQYALLDTNTKWIFTCVLNEPGGGPGENPKPTKPEQPTQPTQPTPPGETTQGATPPSIESGSGSGKAPNPLDSLFDGDVATGAMKGWKWVNGKLVRTGESMIPYIAFVIMTLSIIGFIAVMAVSFVSDWRKKKGAGKR